MMRDQGGWEQARALLERVDEFHPGARRLARPLSLAVRIEAPLLRRARLGIAPDLDAGVESDLWFSLLVSSRSAEAIVLRRDVATVLRWELAEHLGQLDTARRLVLDAHRDESPEILLEEEVIFLGTKGGDDADERVAECLRPALKTLVEQPERGREIARWADRAVGGLPPAAKQNEAVRLLAYGAAARLGPSAQIHREVAGMRLPAGVAWVVPGGIGSGDMEITVRLREDGVDLVHGGGDGHGTLTVPHTLPFVEVGWNEAGEDHARVVMADSGSSISFPPGVTQVRIRTPTGGEYLLTPSPVDTATALPPPAHEPAAWVLQVLQPLASAFHGGAFEGEDFDPRKDDLGEFYRFRTEEDLNDFLHVREVCGTIFSGPVTRYLLAREDPLHDPDETKLEAFHGLIDRAESAGDGGLRPLTEALMQIRWLADEADLEAIGDLLAHDLPTGLKILKGGISPSRWSGQQARLEDSLRTLLQRLRQPELAAIAIRHTNAFQRSFKAFPNTLVRSADFPSYLDQVARLWEVYAGEAERRRGPVTVEILHPIPHSAFEEFAGRFPWVLTPGTSEWVESNSEEGYTAWLSLSTYRQVIRDLYEPLRTRLYQVAREQASRLG